MNIPTSIIIKDNKAEEAPLRPLFLIAKDIIREWNKIGNGVSPHARPYIEAMMYLDTIQDKYIMDSGESIVLYALSNMGTFRGPQAKVLKAELKQHLAKK